MQHCESSEREQLLGRMQEGRPMAVVFRALLAGAVGLCFTLPAFGHQEELSLQTDYNLVPPPPVVAQPIVPDLPQGDPLSQALLGESAVTAVGTLQADNVVAVQAGFTIPDSNRKAILYVLAQIKPGWHIYSLTQAKGTIPTSIKLEDSPSWSLLGTFRSYPPPKTKREPIFDNILVEYHEGRVIWYADIQFATGVDPRAVKIEGTLRFQACDAKSCRPPQEVPFVASLSEAPPVDFSALQAAAREMAQAKSFKPLSTKTLIAVFLSAFLGGLILNLMPCVLPVISLKLFAFIEQAGQSRARVFMLNLWFTIGLMLVFLILATLSATANLAWGEQFTRTWFKVSLTALVFVMALSFLGVWELPIPGFVGGTTTGRLMMQEGVAGAFFKGIFTTILATPCTGPFLGPVLGFTLDKPPYVSYLVFGAAGLGMASPYLIIGLFPQLAKLLPKPGPWMETVKELMGFLLLGTVVYLFTTLNQRFFIPTLALLVALWFGCWLIGKTELSVSVWRKRMAWLSALAISAITAGAAFGLAGQKSHIDWQPFSPQALEQARAAGKTVMVDFTAKWCPNCLFNMAFAIDTPRVAQLIEENGVVPMVADWTDYSPVIEDFLNRVLKRQAIPVLAIWPAGGSDEDVIILDGVLLESQVLEALKKAGPSKDAPATRSEVANVEGS